MTYLKFFICVLFISIYLSFIVGLDQPLKVYFRIHKDRDLNYFVEVNYLLECYSEYNHVFVFFVCIYDNLDLLKKMMAMAITIIIICFMVSASCSSFNWNHNERQNFSKVKIQNQT